MTNPPQPSAAALRVGFVPGVTLTKWRRIWGERYPRVPLEVVEVAVADQRRALDDRVVDMCFVRLPVPTQGLHAIPLYEEVPVAWFAKDHVLSVLGEVTAADLADEQVIEGSEPASVDLAAGTSVVLRVPMSVARSGSRRDMVHRPVTDAPSTTVALAWLVDNELEAIEDFVGVVRGRTPNSTRGTQPPQAGERSRKQPRERRQPTPGSAGKPRRGGGKRPRRR